MGWIYSEAQMDLDLQEKELLVFNTTNQQTEPGNAVPRTPPTGFRLASSLSPGARGEGTRVWAGAGGTRRSQDHTPCGARCRLSDLTGCLSVHPSSCPRSGVLSARALSQALTADESPPPFPGQTGGGKARGAEGLAPVQGTALGLPGPRLLLPGALQTASLSPTSCL